VLRRLLVHISHYSAGSLLIGLAGAISYPFLTRIFSVSDYGVMSLVSATLATLVTVSKLGLQHSVVRFGSQAAKDGSGPEAERFVSTAVFGIAATSCAVALPWLVLVAAIPSAWLGDVRLRALFSMISALVVFQAMESSLVNLLRAQQRTALFTTYQVVNKYLGLALIVTSLLFVGRNLTVFFTAQILSAAAATIVLGVALLRKGSGLPRPTLTAFSPPLFKQMLAYGIPMMIGVELSLLILSLGDRYVIQAVLGPAALGTYTAAYTLCQYVEMVLLTPWSLAIMPIYVRLWAEGGSNPTRGFLERSLRYYVLLGAPVIAGLSAVGPELLAFLASDKFRDGAAIIPPVLGGLVVAGALPIAGAGVFIHKQTWVMARSVLFALLLNLIMNVLWIPKLGIRGAALATLVSYVVLVALMVRAASQHLVVTLPWAVLGRAGVAAAAMFAVVKPLDLEANASTVVLKVLLGVSVYVPVILMIEPCAREGLGALTRGFQRASQ
jgi:O-antigen/teichoic acid export membrane protein